MPPRSALAATAALVLVLALAPSAGATRPPLAPSMPPASTWAHPLGLAGTTGGKQTASCSAHRAHAGALEQKLLPVACEQPPRSQLKIDVLKHAAANAAAALSGP